MLKSMSINPVNEDIESGPEFERIKQNFRNNSIPDAPSSFTEHQILFQNLQLELQTFLGEHMNKVKDLQDLLTNEQKGSSSEHNRQATDKGEPGSMSLHPPDEELSYLNRRKSTDAVSHRTLSNHGVKSTRNTIFVSGHDNMNRALFDTHMHALLSFLQAHSNNIRTLQTSLQNQVPVLKAPSTSATAPHHNSKPPPLSAEDVKYYENVNQQFSMLVVISTFSAGLILAFLSLVYAIVGTNHRTDFSVGMFFSIIAVFIHFGNILIASRGASLTSQQDRHYDSRYFQFYLAMCEQLQFVAIFMLVISSIIMSFLIFSSVAFPIVLLLLSLVGIALVFSSAYWEISITFRNMRYLARNLQRFKQSMEYLRIRGREARS